VSALHGSSHVWETDMQMRELELPPLQSVSVVHWQK